MNMTYRMVGGIPRYTTSYGDSIDRITETNSGNVANGRRQEEEQMAVPHTTNQTDIIEERVPKMGRMENSGGRKGHEVDQRQGLAGAGRVGGAVQRVVDAGGEAGGWSGGPAGLEHRLRELQRHLTQSQSQGEAQRMQYDNQIKRMARQHQDELQRQRHALRKEMRSHQEQEAKIRQAESQQIQVEHAQVKALLKVRTDELSGAQSFLNKADLLSGAEVIAMVDALNSEILQAAASIAESSEFRTVNSTTGSEQKAACERVRSDFGPKIARLLASVRHVEDPMLIQIALQSRLVRDCKMIIELWCFGELHDRLVDVYEAVRKTEDQAVSGRWRALTRSHVRLLRGPAATLQLSKDMIANNLADVLIAGGYHENSEKVREMVMARFNDGITTIANLALRLNQTIGEEVTSSDLGVVYVRDGVAFEPENMEDIGGEGAHPSKADKVLCTTDLGLQQGVKEANGNRTSVLLLKPKVVMESLTKDMSRG